MTTIGDLAHEYRLAGPYAPFTIWEALDRTPNQQEWHQPLTTAQETEYRAVLDQLVRSGSPGTYTDGMLFSGYPDPPEQPKKTTGERRRDRQQALINQGLHPLTRLKLADNGETCKTCAHRVHTNGNSHTYPKCDQTSMSRSEATDCRAWWPACTAWAPQEDG